MTIKELKRIIEDRMLEDDTVVLVEGDDIYDVESIKIQIHSEGRTHLILSSLE